MSISSIGSNSAPQAPLKAPPVEAKDATTAGKDVKNDGDADDSGSTTSASTAAPVINTLGQQLGQNLNVTA